MKASYSYSVLRYHDIVTGECLNLGIMLYSQRNKFLAIKLTKKLNKFYLVFSGFNEQAVKSLCKDLHSQVKKEGELNNSPFSRIVNNILPIDQSAVRFSEEKFGVTENPQKTLNSLYNLFVGKKS